MLVVLALVAVGWFLWNRLDEQDSHLASSDDGRVEREEDETPTASETAPTLKTTGVAEKATAHARPARANRTEETQPAGPRRRIVVRLIGYDAELPEGAALRIEGKIGYFAYSGGASEMPGTIFRKGDAEELSFDLTSHIDNPNAVTLRVYVDHPAYLAATGVIELPSRADAEAAPPASVDVHMRRAFSLLIRVHDPDGKPLDSMGVAVHREGPDGHVVDPKLRYVSSAVDELLGGGLAQWRLRVPEPGRYIVTAAARGRLHVTRSIAVTEPETELEPFVLHEGATITGRVTVAGQVPLACTVAASPVEPAFEFRVAGRAARRVRGALLPGSTHARVRADGTFRLVGLGSEEYRVHVQSIGTPTTAAGLFAGASRVLRAPRDDVHLVVAGSRIRIHVRGPDGRLAHASVLLLPAKEGAPPPDWESAPADHATVLGETDELGVATFAVPAARTWHVMVEHEGMRREVLQVRAPAGGRAVDARIVLRAAAEPDTAMVTINIAPAGGAAGDVLEIRFEGVGDEGPGGTTISEVSTVTTRTKNLTLPIAAGRWRVRVGPADGGGGSPSLALPSTQEIEVTPGTPVTVSVALKRGGLLRLGALDAKGAFVAADCLVRDAKGRKHPLRFSHFGAHHTMRNDLRLGSESASTATTALPEGTYTVVFTHADFAPLTRKVNVRAGKTTPLEVRLQPR